MTKDEEIAMLQKLAETDQGSYFVDTFGQETVTKMQQNIMNDYPILLGTDFYKLSKKNVETIKKTLKSQIKFLENEIELMEKRADANENDFLIKLKSQYIDLVFADNHLKN